MHLVQMANLNPQMLSPACIAPVPHPWPGSGRVTVVLLVLLGQKKEFASPHPQSCLDTRVNSHLAFGGEYSPLT